MIASRNINRFKKFTKIEIEETCYERTDKFEYLGTVLNESYDMAVDVKQEQLNGTNAAVPLIIQQNLETYQEMLN
jgi:hypothetical protein